MKLLLIRHGQSLANTEGRLQGQLDSPLTDLGRQQARALAHRLVRDGWSVSAIHTSDLRRAAETAEILGSALGTPVLPDERLREYDIGMLTGLVDEDVERLYPDVWHDLRQSPVWPAIPGEEGRNAFCRRIASVLEDIRHKYDQEQAVAVVSHGRTLSMIRAQLLEIDPDRRALTAFGNASLSAVEFHPHRALLTCLNDLCHLHDGLRG